MYLHAAFLVRCQATDTTPGMRVIAVKCACSRSYYAPASGNSLQPASPGRQNSRHRFIISPEHRYRIEKLDYLSGSLGDGYLCLGGSRRVAPIARSGDVADS